MRAPDSLLAPVTIFHGRTTSPAMIALGVVSVIPNCVAVLGAQTVPDHAAPTPRSVLSHIIKVTRARRCPVKRKPAMWSYRCRTLEFFLTFTVRGEFGPIPGNVGRHQSTSRVGQGCSHRDRNHRLVLSRRLDNGILFHGRVRRCAQPSTPHRSMTISPSTVEANEAPRIDSAMRWRRTHPARLKRSCAKPR